MFLSLSAEEEVDKLGGQLRGRGSLRPCEGQRGPLSAEGPQSGAAVRPGQPEGQSGPAVRRGVGTRAGTRG